MSPTGAEEQVKPADGHADEEFSVVGHLLDNRRQRRSARELLRLLRSALTLSRRASPRMANLNLALQLGAAILLLSQVILGKLALEAIFEEAGDGGSLGPVIPPLVGLVAASGLAGLATAVQAPLQRLLGERVHQTVAASILDVTTTVSVETFEGPEFHNSLERVLVNAGVQPLRLAHAMVSLVGGTLGGLFLVVAIATIEPLLLVALVISAVPLALISRRSGALEFAFSVAQTHRNRLRGYLQDVLTGRDEAKEVRAFDLSGVLLGRWRSNYQDYLGALQDHTRQRAKLAALSALVTFLATTASLALLVALVLDDQIGLPSAGAALIAIRLLATRVTLMFDGVTNLFECSLFLRDYETFLERAPELDPFEDDGAEPLPPFDELTATDLRFRYPQTDRDVLKDVSISIRAGEVIALVGESGSGKTTLAKLLCQIFTPTWGEIRWDGVDTRALSGRGMRDHIGVIFQDFVRYQLSARENIGFGRAHGVDDIDAIVAAARRGNADDFLSTLPQGYETTLGKTFWGGHDLSIGQWQRVAIARAFFRDADFLVLDEPTASLDARSEHRLFEQVRELSEGRALMLISHRFSTVRSADRIYVLHHGEIIEQGNHDELMALDGHYAELFALQAKSYWPG